MTGKALQHAISHSLLDTNGNRNNTHDNVILITDGRSQDDVNEVSAILKDRGVQMYAVGLGLKGKRGYETVMTVVSQDDHGIFYPHVDEGSLYDIAMKISRKIHEEHCP